jgi:hypothetical protein
VSKLDYPRRASLYGKPVNAPVNTTQAVNTNPVNTRAADRHKPGYMAEYMRKRRANARHTGPGSD